MLSKMVLLSQLLVELFGLYLDSQLPPDPSDSEGRVFSTKHIITTPEKPPQNADYPIIHVTQVGVSLLSASLHTLLFIFLFYFIFFFFSFHFSPSNVGSCPLLYGTSMPNNTSLQIL